MSRSPAIASLFMTAVLVLAVICSFTLDRPPAALGLDAASDQFSAARALVHVRALARTAHPSGLVAQQTARDYLIMELRELGLSPEIQRAVGVAKKYPVAGSLENIVARIPGTSGQKEALALVAHYDSVAAGPGAADDGAGVAALLETARALMLGPKPRNDIVLLFTDGEEAGLLGASAFIDAHPWARDIRLALNFDVRGSSGNAWLFETSAGNGSLIKAWAHVTPYPVGSSLTDEVYKRLPNDTDMTVFKAASIPLLNFAFVDGWEHYHTPLDRPELLDPRSLQHLGFAAFALAKHFSAVDLMTLKAPDAVYFSVPGGWVLRYPASLAPASALLTTLVFIAVMILLKRRGLLFKRRMLAGALLAVGSVVVAALMGYCFELLIHLLHVHLIHDAPILYSGLYSWASVLFVLAILIRMQRMFVTGERWQAASALGQLAVWIVVLWVACFTMRGASYLLFVPLMLSLSAIALCVSQWRFKAALIAVLAIPTLLIFAPLEHALFTLFGFSMIGNIAIAAILALLLSFLATQLNFIHRSKMLAIASMLFGIALTIVAAFTVRYSPEHPSRSTQLYVLDADTHQALWVNDGPVLDRWSRNFFGPDPQRRRVNVLRAAGFDEPMFVHAAPAADLPASQVTLISSEPHITGRLLTLHIASPRGARRLSVHAAANRVLQARIAGHQVATAKGGSEFWQLMYVNIPAGGFDLQLNIRGNAPVKIEAIDRSEGLPRLDAQPVSLRPPDSISYGSGDVTMTHRSFTF